MIAGARSLLYVPGDRADRLAKAWGRGADALIVDLEDAVAPDRKPLARRVVRDWLGAQPPELAARVLVRVTADEPADDLAAIPVPVGAVMVAKAEIPLVARVAELLGAQESSLGWAPGTTAIVPLIETARGLLQAVDLATAPRVRTLAIGRADLAGELGLRVDPDGPEFRSLMLGLVVACAASGIAPPIAPTATDFRRLDALRESTSRLLELGFRGRTAVHPDQLAVINEVFTPTAQELAEARAAVEGFQRAGGGAHAEGGRMIDAAVVRSMREVLSREHPPAGSR